MRLILTSLALLSCPGIALAYVGPGLGAGAIGLRQMSHTGECAYGRFRVWAVSNL